MINRIAKLFEAASYPDRGIDISPEMLDEVITNTMVPIPIKIEHTDTALDGFMGSVVKLFRRGRDLFGEIALPVEVWELVRKAGAQKLSVGFESNWKSLREVSIVNNPRVETAHIYSFANTFVFEEEENMNEKIEVEIDPVETEVTEAFTAEVAETEVAETEVIDEVAETEVVEPEVFTAEVAETEVTAEVEDVKLFTQTEVDELIGIAVAEARKTFSINEIIDRWIAAGKVSEETVGLARTILAGDPDIASAFEAFVDIELACMPQPVSEDVDDEIDEIYSILANGLGLKPEEIRNRFAKKETN